MGLTPRAAPATKSPSGAEALSKGALRALRAKARQEEQQSLEWSALSRSNSSRCQCRPLPNTSTAPGRIGLSSPTAADTAPRGTTAPFHPMPDPSRRGSVFSEISAASGFAAQHQHQNQLQPLSLFGGAAEEFFDTQPQTATWVGQQQLAQQHQQYAYPPSMGQPMGTCPTRRGSTVGSFPQIRCRRITILSRVASCHRTRTGGTHLCRSMPVRHPSHYHWNDSVPARSPTRLSRCPGDSSR